MFLELCSHTSQNRHGCRFRSNAYKDVCLLRWRTYRKPISEFLEHLASYNGADMRKYNTLYTRKLSVHVLPPESLLEIFLYLCILQALLAVLPPISSLKVFLSNFYLRIYASSCRNLSRIIEEISSTSSFPSP